MCAGKRRQVRLGSKIAAGGALLLAALLAGGCGKNVPAGALVVPRGATISVTTVKGVSSDRNAAGTGFLARLDSPLRKDDTVYARVGAQVDGVIESVETNEEGLPKITVRLRELRLSDGNTVPLETNTISRDAKSLAGVAGETLADSGIEEKIDRLAGISSDRAGSAKTSSGAAAVIPANSTMVFTLSSDLIIPHP